MVKVAIAVPNPGHISTPTVASLIGISHYDRINSVFMPHLTTYLDMARAELVQKARMHECSHILFVDSDMTFQPDVLVRLLDHNKQVVAANYQRRRRPGIYTAMKDGDHVTEEGKTGLEQVATIGLGLALIQCEVFSSIRDPWFRISNFYEGEDTAFCQRCDDAGIPIFIDHDVSQLVGHLTVKELRVGN